MLGFEPRNAGVKVQCLTAWLHPIIFRFHRRESGMNLGDSRVPAGRLCRPRMLNDLKGSQKNRRFSVGWIKGLEPSTSGTTIQRSNQLSYTHLASEWTPLSYISRYAPDIRPLRHSSFSKSTRCAGLDFEFRRWLRKMIITYSFFVCNSFNTFQQKL